MFPKMTNNSETKHLEHLYQIEAAFDLEKVLIFLNNHMYLPFVISAIYVLLVQVGKLYMVYQPAKKLKNTLTIWNLTLAIINLGVLLRTGPEFVYLMKTSKLYRTVCIFDNINNQRIVFWGLVFLAAKVLELFDTAFLVFRKRPVIFLHWFHHSSVLIFCWYLGVEKAGPARYFGVMNAAIHVVMYTYFALKSLNLFKISQKISIGITLVQVAQMFVGIFITVYLTVAKWTGEVCDVTPSVLLLCILIYSAYLVLFVYYFCTAYVWNSKKNVVNANSNVKKLN